ncbi:hypothetical protein FEM33_17235 [Dyadobacter flavalbus]|uniref:Uncharacterized protein n=1 Tax=Dyadobacter flavalbus TaxID=2579942 RepID=A0A5M8QT40_9BACT|nr:hypothetical protein [Dyadobacter flavalbus]KAA6438431.1 hypothetical protein FEM33_17235 [Dyadobacter flavalbus]
MSQSTASPTLLGTTPAINKNLSITNSSSVAITMLDGVGTDDSQMAYEQNLTQYTTADGQKSIPAKGTGTIVLDDTHDNNGTPTYSKAYSIIYAMPSNLFPVKIKGSLLAFKTQDFAPVTVTDDDAAVMTQTEQFLQTIMANPTSTLAQNYAAAMQAAQNAASSDTDVDDAVTRFFAATNGFQSVTLDAITTVSTYYKTYPFVWTGYQPSKTLYFYSSDGSNVTYEGSITITVPAAASVDKSLPGFSFTFTDASNATKPLYFVNGMFVDDKTSDVPAIALSGLFALKSTLTKVATDNTIIPILTGTINNAKVLGYETKATQNPDGDWSGLYSLLHPKNAAGYLALFSTFIGLVMGVEVIEKYAKALKDKLFDKKVETADQQGLDSPDDVELTPQQVQDAKTDVKTEMTPVETRMQAMLDKIQSEYKLNQDLLESMKATQAEIQEQLKQDKKAELEDEGEAMEEELQGALDAGVNNKDLDNEDDAIDSDLTSLDSASAEELPGLLDSITLDFGGLKIKVDVTYSTAIKNAKGDAASELAEGKKISDDAKSEADNIEKEGEQAETGDTKESETDFTQPKEFDA